MHLDKKLISQKSSGWYVPSKSCFITDVIEHMYICTPQKRRFVQYVTNYRGRLKMSLKDNQTFLISSLNWFMCLLYKAFDTKSTQIFYFSFMHVPQYLPPTHTPFHLFFLFISTRFLLEILRLISFMAFRHTRKSITHVPKRTAVCTL